MSKMVDQYLQQDMIGDIMRDLKDIQEQELQSEEKHLDDVVKQKLKLAKIKQDYTQKDETIRILQLENQKLMKYKPYHTKYNKLKDILSQCLLKLEEHEQNNAQLQSTVVKLHNQIELLLQESAKLETYEKINFDLAQDKQSMQQQYQQIELIYYQQKSEFQTKEASVHKDIESLQAKLKSSQTEQVRLKSEMDQIKTIVIEKEKDNINLLQKIKSYQENQQDQMAKQSNVSQTLKKNQIKNNEVVEKKQKKILQEYKTIQAQLNKQQIYISIMSLQYIHKENQENQINSYLSMQEQMKEQMYYKDRDLQQSKALCGYLFLLYLSKLAEEFDETVCKMAELEDQVSEQRKETLELKKYISYLLEKQQMENLYKAEIENVKLNMLEDPQDFVNDI